MGRWESSRNVIEYLLMAAVDVFGNTYPPECEGRYATRTIPIERVDMPHDLPCLWLLLPGGPMIVVDEGLSKSAESACIEHERCHQRMYELHGDGDWH